MENVFKNNLPKYWQLNKLCEVSQINPKIPNNDTISDDLEIQFLPMKLVEEVVGKIHLNETRKYGEVKKGYTPFINNDVIFAKVTPCMENGKIALVNNLKNEIGFGSSEFHVIRANKNILSKYIFHFVVQDKFRNEAANEMTGAVGLRRVPKHFLENYLIPIPPLPEQQVIVSKIEELLSELENGKLQLQTAQQQLKVYRQSLLKWAFEGKLTETKDIKWVKLGEVLEFVGSGVTPKGGQNVYQKQGVIFIRSQNVYPNKLVLDDVAFISNEIDDRMKRTRVYENDVLLNITGASIGRTAYVPKEFPRGNVNQHVCILRSNQQILDCVFLSSYLNSPKAQSEIMNEQAGATRQGLNFQQIRNLVIPICPIDEQQLIVNELESKLTECNKMEETISNSLQQAESLRQSILKKAFEGRLINSESQIANQEKV